MFGSQIISTWTLFSAAAWWILQVLGVTRAAYETLPPPTTWTPWPTWGCSLPIGLATNSIFLLKNRWSLWRANQSPLCWGNTILFPFLPATPSSLSRTLEEKFWAWQGALKGTQIASCVASGTNQGHHQVCRARCREVQGHRHKQLTWTVIVRLLQTHFCTPIFDGEKSTE